MTSLEKKNIPCDAKEVRASDRPFRQEIASEPGEFSIFPTYQPAGDEPGIGWGLVRFELVGVDVVKLNVIGSTCGVPFASFTDICLCGAELQSAPWQFTNR